MEINSIENLTDVKSLALKMKGKILDTGEVPEGLEVLALIIDLVAEPSSRVHEILNESNVPLEDLRLSKNDMEVIRNIDRHAFVRNLLEDQGFIQEHFLENDPRYGSHFKHSVNISSPLPDYTYFVNPQVGMKPEKHQRIHFTVLDEKGLLGKLGQIEWAVQWTYMKACGVNPHHCTKGETPRRFLKGRTVYFSHYFHKEDDWADSKKEVIMDADMAFIDKAMANYNPRRTKITAFLPEEMNHCEKCQDIRKVIMDDALIRSATTYQHNEHGHTAWHLEKSKLTYLENGNRKLRKCLLFLDWFFLIVGLSLLVTGIILFDDIISYSGVALLILMMSMFAVSIILRNNARKRKPHFIGLCLVNGIPSDKDNTKIREKILSIEKESEGKNNEYLSRGDVPFHKKQEEGLHNGFNKLSDSCEVSFYAADTRVRQNFKAFIHQPDYKALVLEDIVDGVELKLAEDEDKLHPWIGELKDSYIDCQASKLHLHFEGHDRAYVFHYDTVLLNLKTWQIVDINTKGCLVSQREYDESMIAVKLKDDETPKIRRDYLLKMLMSDFVKEQVPSKDRKQLLKAEIPCPDINVQTSDILLDQNKEYVGIIRDHKHELGNVLARVYDAFDLMAGMIRDDRIAMESTRTTVKEYLIEMEDAFEIISSLMKNFWKEDFAKDADDLNLKDFLECFIKRQHSDKYETSLIFNYPNESLTVRFSADDLESILQNMFLNADRHGFTSTERTDYKIIITVDKADNDDYVLVKVSNNGKRLSDGLTPVDVLKNGIGEGDSEHIGLGIIKSKCEKNNSFFTFDDKESSDGFHIVNTIKISRI